MEWAGLAHAQAVSAQTVVQTAGNRASRFGANSRPRRHGPARPLDRDAADGESRLETWGTCLIPSTEGVASATHVSPVTCYSNKLYRREAATIYHRPCTLHSAAQLQPIHALRLACGAQRVLLPVTVGAMNIHDVRDRRRQTSDVRQHHCLMSTPRGVVGIIILFTKSNQHTRIPVSSVRISNVMITDKL